MELWDVYDIHRNKTGETRARYSKSTSPKNTFNMVVHVCIFNSQGQMLIQQRQSFKNPWANLWDVSVGGNAVAGEFSQAAAEREAFEEIGCKLDLSNVRPHFSATFDTGFDDFYLVEADIDIETLRLQYEEVQQVKWASQAEILDMVAQDIFIPYHESLIELLFAMHKAKEYGSHTR